MTEAMTKWYVVAARPGKEWDAYCEMHMPPFAMRPWMWYRHVERIAGPPHRRRTQTVPEAYFKGYLFIPATSRLAALKDASYAIDVVRGGGSVPLGIPDSALRALAKALGVLANGYVPPSPPAEEVTVLAAGTRIRVSDGPFIGFLATLAESAPMDGRTRIKALIEAFARPTPVELDQGHVEVA